MVSQMYTCDKAYQIAHFTSMCAQSCPTLFNSRPQSMGLQKVYHNWTTNTFTFSPLLYKADSYPLDHQGSPLSSFQELSLIARFVRPEGEEQGIWGERLLGSSPALASPLSCSMILGQFLSLSELQLPHLEDRQSFQPHELKCCKGRWFW